MFAGIIEIFGDFCNKEGGEINGSFAKYRAEY